MIAAPRGKLSNNHQTVSLTDLDEPFDICNMPACKIERVKIINEIVRIARFPTVIAEIVAKYNRPIHEVALRKLLSTTLSVLPTGNIESNQPQCVQNNIFILLSKMADITGYPYPHLTKSICYPHRIIELARSVCEYDSWEESAATLVIADIFYHILTLGWTGVTIDHKKIECRRG